MKRLLQPSLIPFAVFAFGFWPCVAPVVAQTADFKWSTNNGAITIIRYNGFGGAVTIPSVITGLPVTTIGEYAFNGITTVTSVTIPDTVTSIGYDGFAFCTSMTNVTIGGGVTNIGPSAFEHCVSLRTLSVPDSVKIIESLAFYWCSRLRDVTVGEGVSTIGYSAFAVCTNLARVTLGSGMGLVDTGAFNFCYSLQGVYFRGNAPATNGVVSSPPGKAIVYYLPGKSNWGPKFGGLTTAPWSPQIQVAADMFGVSTNRFGFDIAWASNMTATIEVCTNLADSAWLPLHTNTLTADTFYFSDADWAEYPRRFYRVRSQ